MPDIRRIFEINKPIEEMTEDEKNEIAEIGMQVLKQTGISAYPNLLDVDWLKISPETDKTRPKNESAPPKIKPLSAFHNENSAGVMLTNLQSYYKKWSKNIPEEYQIAVYCFLPNGQSIQVSRFKQEGQNGICVEGKIGEGSCLFLMNQSQFQVLCVAEPIPKGTEKKQIGFIYDKEKE